MAEHRIEKSADASRDWVGRSANLLLAGTPSASASTVFAEMESSLIGKANIEPAEESDVLRRYGVMPAAVRHCAYLSSLSLRDQRALDLPYLLYLTLRKARVWGKNTVLLIAQDRENPVARLLEARSLDPIAGEASDSGQGPLGQDINYAMQTCFSACAPESQKRLQAQMPAEIIDTFDRWIERLFSGAWFRAVYEKRLAKEQYVRTLFELHHYVRQTTRHLGRAIALCEDRPLRNHYIDHLRGEVNHELSIELDLKHLGVDTSYLVHSRVPSLRTKQFMALQESTIGF